MLLPPSSPGLSLNLAEPDQVRLTLETSSAADSPVAELRVVSAHAAAAAGGRRRQAAEPRRRGVPLVEADAAAQGVAPRGARRALLGGHLQELPRPAGERWGRDQASVGGVRS